MKRKGVEAEVVEGLGGKTIEGHAGESVQVTKFRAAL